MYDNLRSTKCANLSVPCPNQHNFEVNPSEILHSLLVKSPKFVGTQCSLPALPLKNGIADSGAGRWARSWASRGWKFRTLRDNFPNIFPSDWTFVPLCPNVVLDYLLRISCIHFLQYTIYNVYTHIQNIHTHEQEFEYRPSNRHLVLTVFDFLRGADGLCGGLSSHS